MAPTPLRVPSRPHPGGDALLPAGNFSLGGREKAGEPLLLNGEQIKSKTQLIGEAPASGAPKQLSGAGPGARWGSPRPAVGAPVPGSHPGHRPPGTGPGLGAAPGSREVASGPARAQKYFPAIFPVRAATWRPEVALPSSSPFLPPARPSVRLSVCPSCLPGARHPPYPSPSSPPPPWTFAQSLRCGLRRANWLNFLFPPPPQPPKYMDSKGNSVIKTR